MSNTEIISEIEQIKLRNSRVELDKSWETSNFRKISIAVVTYMFMTVFFYTIGVDMPYINSLVPTFGYLLSTLTLGVIKNIWIKRHTNGRK